MNRPAPAASPRNPGPSWGYRFIVWCDGCLPEFLFKPLRAAGTAVAILAMPRQRRHSREYLAHVLPHPPRFRDVFRHFFAFTEFLLLRLRVGRGRPHRGRLVDRSGDFADFLDRSRPALLGSFHIGHSDLLGFLLARRDAHRIVMVRQRVGNSHDVDLLLKQCGDSLRIIWVNEAENLLFALKDAAAGREALALKCDRIEHTAKTEAFSFLGARRQFPVTIYHLALIFDRPVIFSVGLPGADGETIVYDTPAWQPDHSLNKAANLAAARVHFQAFLNRVEALLREHPYQWFNYIPLNPTTT